jgi:hypothetical protein
VDFAALRALGGAPVMMPVTDVMTGLQTELMDSVAVPPVGAVVFQMAYPPQSTSPTCRSPTSAALLVDRKAFDGSA